MLRAFCRLDCNRLEFLKTFLEWKKIGYCELNQGGHHLLIRPSGCKAPLSDHYMKVLTAHYDRVEGSPGANDNSASIFILLKHLEILRNADFSHNTMILFTDREERTEGKNLFDQGAYQLGQYWKETLGEGHLFIVLDMCGIGDTLVWGKNTNKLNTEESGQELAPGLVRTIDSLYESLSELFYRYSRQSDMAVNTLFSDDLGFILSGMPAIQLSQLPWKEAEQWKKDSNRFPESWKVNHTLQDSIETLQDTAMKNMYNLLRDLARYQLPLPL